MAEFCVYKYGYKKMREQSLFSGTEAELDNTLFQALHTAQMQNAVSDRQLDLYITKKNRKGVEERKEYINQFLWCKNGVALIEVRNTKVRTYTPKDSTEKEKVDDYPYCWVVIDTRPHSRLILVQKKREAFGDTDFVAKKLIQKYCEDTLGMALGGWKYEVKKRYCSGDFWDIIHTRLLTGTDKVRTVSIQLNHEHQEATNEVDKALQFIMQKLAAPTGELNLYASDDTHPLLDEKNTDLVETVNLLLTNDYTLKVKFDKSGTFEYGKKADALYGIDDDEVQEAETLMGWIDIILGDDAGHEFADIPKRKGRKQHDTKRETT